MDDAPQYAKIKNEKSIDVCVIGAGFTGLSTAIYLAEQGYRVVVLEAHQIEAGGFGRNVGLVNAGT